MTQALAHLEGKESGVKLISLGIVYPNTRQEIHQQVQVFVSIETERVINKCWK